MSIKLRGSSSAFAKGRLVHTRYPTGCLRKLLLQHHNVREVLKEHTIALGALNEQQYEQKLVLDGTVVFERESPVVCESHVTSDAVFSGRVDFKIVSAVAPRLIELKSTQSKNKLTAIRKEGSFEGVTPENLAQTVAYMLYTDTAEASLIYTYWSVPKGKETLVATFERAYAVTFDACGAVCIDGHLSGFTVQDFYAHQASVYVHLSENRVGPRPHNYDSKWSSPCGYCPFAAACEKYDQNPLATTSSFIDDAKECLTAIDKV